MDVSVLITTFNRPDALDLVFKTLACQTVAPREIIVCDDGSSPDTAKVIHGWCRYLPVRHVWLSDQGFRAARARNLGILAALSSYLIFLDGDCLMPSTFVESHIGIARRGTLVSGGRVLLDAEKTESFLGGRKHLDKAFHHWKFLRLPFGVVRDCTSQDWRSVRSCNFGIFRDEAVNVGGFDESYVGWGREDSDFVVRLIRHGIKVRSGRLAACVAHLHHFENPRDQLSENDARFHACQSDPTHIHSKSSILAQS